MLLILSSCVFYAHHNPRLLLLLISSITINVFTSYYIQFGSVYLRRGLATLGVMVNLGILAIFKYSPLIASTFLNPESDLAHKLVSIPLPIGISFFTFQGLSLMVDTYRAKDAPSASGLIQHDFLQHFRNTFFYIAFFPQLIAGPIVKAYQFLPQIGLKYLNNVNWDYCIRHIILGYFLKMVIADNLKDFTFNIEYPYFLGLSSLELLFLLLGYSIQIFADFAGYSIIAIGLAGLFGYTIPINFDHPYISQTFSEFWRRWHISLSTFLKEYLYIPLGGNRKGVTRTYINLFLVMAIGGAWHGAAWSYAVWGIYHGTLLCIERWVHKAFPPKGNAQSSGLRMLFVFIMVSMGWLLFKLPDFSHVIMYAQAMFSNELIPGEFHTLIFISLFSFPVIAYHLHYVARMSIYKIYYGSKWAQSMAYAFMLFMIITNYGSSNAFIYFQF